MWNAFWIRSVGVVTDGCGSGSTMDIVSTYKPNSASARWTSATGNPLSLDAGSDEQIWRRTADTPSISSADIKGLSCQLDITALMPAGKRIYAIRGYAEPRDSGEDQA
jgi:hypothetical protein